MELLVNGVLLVLGFVMLVKGADLFVDGASGIAHALGIPPLIVGLTIVAMGTSAPEAAISIASATRGSADITIGNVIGSNIMNILMVLGLSAAVTTLAVERSTIRFEVPFVVTMSCLLLFLGLDGTVGRTDGAILWVFFLAYLAYLFHMTRSAADVEAEEEAKEDADEKPRHPMWRLALFVLLGILGTVVGSNVTVDAATAIALALGMSERMVGLTIVALGTSLPELVTCVTAARKNEADIAIGNIVGSCIFNVLFVVGTTALVTTIPFAAAFRLDMLVSIAAAVLLWLCMLPHKHLSYHASIPLLLGYLGYLFFLVR